MSGEHQDTDRGDQLLRNVSTLKIMWFGLFVGGLIINLLMIYLVVSNDGEPIVDLGDLGYLLFALVPLSLFAGFFIAPKIAPQDPRVVLEEARRKGLPGYNSCDAVDPEDPLYWFPTYSARITLQLWFLEAGSVVSAIGFLTTANWAMLGGALLLGAAMVVVIPNQSAAETFAEQAKARQS